MHIRTKPSWPTFLDGASDGLVLAFAAWTVFYQFALAGQFSMLWAGWPWLVLAACLAFGSGLHASRKTEPEPGDDDIQRAQPPKVQTSMLDTRVLLVVLAVLAVLVTGRERWGVWPVAVTAIAVLLAQVLPWRGKHAPHQTSATTDGPVLEAGQWPHVFALAASLGFGVLGLFLLRPDADDAFYVNRAAWVAQHGTAATNDTMFSANTLPPAYGGGLLTPSIEALQGVVAHAVGIEAATLCYLLAVPVLGTMAGWTTWRLARAWAPRRPTLVMAASMIFLVASADSIVGNYSLGRIWQGKATAYLILIPLVWLLLSRTVDRARRTEIVMLVAAGIAFVGLTTTSALLAPVIAGSGLLASAILRSRPLALGSLAFLAAPLANGLVQAFGPAAIGGGGATAIVQPEGAFLLAFGPSLAMILLGLLAVTLVPRSISGATGVILGCGALATMVALLPGVFELTDAVTGAGAVAWRLLIAMPTWVLVGLLVAMPRPDVRSQHHGGRHISRTAGAGVLAAVVLVVPLVSGTLLWKAPGASLTARPTWKVDQTALSDVRAARELDTPPGRWLMPPDQMTILAISTVGPFSVVPRSFYLSGLDVEHQNLSDRVALFHLVEGKPVSVRTVRGALDRLGVSLACVDATDIEARQVLRRAIRAQLKPVGDMYCHEL